jgi:hypothetical protein
MDMFFEKMSLETGWAFTTVMGGPFPRENGNITSASHHVRLSQARNDFGRAYTRFDEDIMLPFQNFLREIFREFSLKLRSASAPH